MRYFLLFGLLLLTRLVLGQRPDERLARHLLQLGPESKWTRIASIPLKFDAHHTQGMVKIGEFFFMTAVEVSQWPKKFEKPVNGLDRDPGKGKGHVFKFDKEGNKLADLPIGKGDIYHPGGIDYDGKYIWIPVTEYRPNSFSIVYRLDPLTLELTEVLRCRESIGAIVRNTDRNTLVGANWGARKFYTWKLDRKYNVNNNKLLQESPGIENPSFYVDFQDCKYLGNDLMLGSGFSTYKDEGRAFRLGGWEIFNLRDNRPVRQIPLKLWSPSGASMLANPCAVEATEKGIRAYFVPDDDEKAVLFIYEAE